MKCVSSVTNPISVSQNNKAHVLRFVASAKDRLEKLEFIARLDPLAVRLKDRVRKIRKKLALTLNSSSPNKKNVIRVEFA